MSAEQERIDAHRASVMAWAHRIPSVLASPDAARKLALGVVTELLATFTRKPLDLDVMGEIARLCGEAIYQAGDMSIGDVRAAADTLGSRLFLRAPQRTWAWTSRIAYEVCEALRRACEDSLSLCGECITEPCTACDGSGSINDHAICEERSCDHTCPTCKGARMVAVEPLVPPILALLIRDSHALLTDLRADVSGLESLVREAEGRERARTKGRDEG